MKKILIVLLLCLLPAASYAQPFEKAVRRNLWNDGLNAAGLRCDSLSFANAELGVEWNQGDFRNISDPEQELLIGAKARGVRHLGKFSMAGSFSFTQKEWYGASGSMLMDAWRYPFDSYEFIPGRKTFQIYDMSGLISVDVAPSWRVGARVDLKTRNAAKRKDLRYTGYMMDFDFVPSVQYSADLFSIGATVHYSRNTQTVSAEQIGTSKELPRTFFDEGVMTGTDQEWSGTGSHLSVSGVAGFPVAMDRLGVGLQASVCGFYLDAEYATFGGKAGEKQTIWYRYGGSTLDLKLGWKSDGHSVRAGAVLERMGNFRTVMDKKTEGGVTIMTEYGANEILDRRSAEVFAEYEYIRSGWELKARPYWTGTGTAGYPMFPYVVERKNGMFGLALTGICHFRFLDVTAGLEAGSGYLEDSESVAAEGVGVTSSLTHFADVQPGLYSSFVDYSRCTRLGGRLAARWNFGPGLYTEIGGGLQGGVTAPKAIRWSAGFRFGYNF